MFGIFLMRQAMESIPNEFIEAGMRIDGASEFSIYWKLILPQTEANLSAPGYLYLYGPGGTASFSRSLSSSSRDQYTHLWGSGCFRGQYWSDMGLVMTGATISVIPILIVFLCMQKTFVRGVTLTGLKA